VTANIADFMDNKEAVFHVGAAYSHSNENPGTTAITIRSEGRGTDVFKANGFSAASATNNGYDLNRKALEAAIAYGPVKFQSEYIKADFEPDGNTPLVTGAIAGKDYSIDAWYAAVTWMITGENYADTYKDGLWGRIKPKNDFVAPGAPGWGAWEVGARYSKLDASDFEKAQTAAVYNVTTTPKTVGVFNEADAWTVGLKWIPNPNVRYMLDYIDTNMDCVKGVDCTNDSEKAINLRAQIDF
jgi:phosphate-selective porin OprO/OprP